MHPRRWSLGLLILICVTSANARPLEKPVYLDLDVAKPEHSLPGTLASSSISIDQSSYYTEALRTPEKLIPSSLR